MQELRREEKEKQLCALLNKYGQEILIKLINDCSNYNEMIWPLIYKYSTDHLRDVKQIIKNNYQDAIRSYFNCLSEEELDEVLELYSDDDIVIKNLPYSKKIYTWINGHKKENEYWENQYFSHLDKDDFEYLFNKFVKFAPEKLVAYCMQHMEIGYNHCINVLKAIARIYIDKAKQKSIRNEIVYIKEFVRKMDSKYYTDELSLCEFEILSILKPEMEDYPMGIKNFFWNNPSELGNFLIQLYEQKNSFVQNDIARNVLYSTITPIGNVCYIPKEYLIQKRSSIKKWIDDVLECGKTKPVDLIQFLEKAVISILAACPKDVQGNIWPIKEIADILEYIGSTNKRDELDVSRCFFAAYVNKIGVRLVTDGTPEYSLYQEFKRYQEYYQLNHPVTCKALELICQNYNNESEEDKRIAVLGH